MLAVNKMIGYNNFTSDGQIGLGYLNPSEQQYEENGTHFLKMLA